MITKNWKGVFMCAVLLVACPSSTTPDTLTIDDVRWSYVPTPAQDVSKGWRYFDGCNTTTCYGAGDYCTTTLVNCPTAEGRVLFSGMPPCDPAKPLKAGESCIFEVKP